MKCYFEYSLHGAEYYWFCFIVLLCRKMLCRRVFSCRVFSYDIRFMFSSVVVKANQVWHAGSTSLICAAIL